MSTATMSQGMSNGPPMSSRDIIGGRKVANNMKKGSTVIVVEGPHRGKEGKVLDVYRSYDKESKTTGKRVEIELEEIGQDGEKKVIQTRAAWAREIR